MPEKRALVSVVIPCYNAEQYLEQAIQSAEAQSYPNIEIICIDDGSVDRTLELLERLQRKSGRSMKVIRQSNRGVSAARNAGIRLAEGDYIAFLDADDMYSPKFIEILVDAAERTGADAACCRWTYDAQSYASAPESKGELQKITICIKMKHLLFSHICIAGIF